MQNLPDDEEMICLSSAGRKLEQLVAKKKKADEEMEALDAEIKELREVILPSIMEGVGIADFSLSSGVKLKMESFYSGKLSEDTKDDAITWLKKTNNLDIVKSEVVIPFGRGALNTQEYAELQDFLCKKGLAYTAMSSIHPKTMSAFLKEQITAGNELPRDLFNVYAGRRVVIK